MLEISARGEIMKKITSKCNKLIDRDNKVIGKASRAPYFPLAIKKGKGAIFEDLDGKKYIDFFSSAAVLNTGHAHPKIIEAIKEQMENYLHFTSDCLYTEAQVDLAEKLIEISPGSFEKRVIFGLSGSDANDGAIKLARSYTGRSKILSFIGAYHGATYGAISLTAINLDMRRKIGPLLPDIHHIPYPNCYRCIFGEKADDCSLKCLEYMKHMLKTYIPPEEVAAIIIEPILGDLGFIVPSANYMQELYKFCKEKGILFIVDEVQQGFGRTGRWFSIEHFDISPDIILMGKSIASGLPLSAIVGKEEIINSLEMSHIFTLQGNAVCAKAALATIKIIEEENLINNSKIMGEYIKARFSTLKEKYKLIGDVRGKGLSMGIDLVKDRITKEKDKEAAAKISYSCWQKGLLLIFLAENVLRIQPPLIIKKAEIEKAIDIIEKSIQEYMDGLIPDSVLDKVKGW